MFGSFEVLLHYTIGLCITSICLCTMADLFDRETEVKPIPYTQRIQKNARRTLETIEVPIVLLVIAINTMKERPLSEDEQGEVDEALRLPRDSHHYRRDSRQHHIVAPGR